MEDQIIKKLQDHDQRFDSMDKRFNLLATTVVDIQEQVNDIKETMATKTDIANLSIAIVNNQEQINDIKETMATKTDIAKISNTLDVIVGLYKKTDQESTFMGERVRRVEEKTQKNTEDIQITKPLVGLKTT